MLPATAAFLAVVDEPARVAPSGHRSPQATSMLQRSDWHSTQFSSCSHHALISEHFTTLRLTCVCHICRNQHMGETKCQRRRLPLTPSCTCASSCGYRQMPCSPTADRPLP